MEHRPLACAPSGDVLSLFSLQRVINPLAAQTGSLCSGGILSRHLKSAIRNYALLFFACVPFHILGTWSLPLIDRDEPRFAEASREMIERRNYTSRTSIINFDSISLPSPTGHRSPAIKCSAKTISLLASLRQ